jgi:outer membrane protein assembly factor BamB
MRSRREALAVAVCAVIALGSVLALYADPPWHHDGRISAYDLRTGATRFDVAAATASVRVEASDRHTLVLSGADDCSGRGGGSVFAVDAETGARLWSHGAPDGCAEYGAACGAITDGVVALAVRNGVDGRDALTGARRWTIPARGAQTFQTPTAVVVAAGRRVRRVSPVDGHTLDTLAVGGQATPIARTRGLIVFEEQRADRTVLRAVDPSTGVRRWTAAMPIAGGVSRWYATATAVVVANGGDTIGLSPGSGRRRWRVGLGANDLVAAGAGLALFEHGDRLIARDLASGRPRWSRRWASHGASAAAADGVVALTSGFVLTVLDARTGSVRWRRLLPIWHVRVAGTPLIRDGVIYVPSWSTSYTPYGE